jgi:hypothetical protein
VIDVATCCYYRLILQIVLRLMMVDFEVVAVVVEYCYDDHVV